MQNIRNFVIIAHIDHGKSTLADRLLEITGTVEKRAMRAQYLDSMDLERERGITIKMTPVRMLYRANAREFVLNLIDTPGHSDFSYEVSRALAAVEGAVLLVDATQGIQAQTLANFENAKRAGLTIIGAVNKIDAATEQEIDPLTHDLAALIGCAEEDILKLSGRTGTGVPELLETIIKKIPAPRNEAADAIQRTNQRNSANLRALIFDSKYDDHKGVVAFVRMMDSSVRAGDTLALAAAGASFQAKEIGIFSPKLVSREHLEAGEIGYIATGLKDPDILKIGDTIIAKREMTQAKKLTLPGYREPSPVVFVSFYPEDAGEYDELQRALSKLRLTDAALHIEPDKSEVLGRGFKGGFLGRLHFEIAAERLLREFGVSTVHSFPSVAYRVETKREGWIIITNPKDFPDDRLRVEEPITKVEIVAPLEHLGAILGLKAYFRFSNIETMTLHNKVVVAANLPLADIIRDLDDKLKSATAGYASLAYEVTGYAPADVEKLEVRVAEQTVPGLTRILPKEDIEREARRTVEKLKELLPQEQFPQALQAISRGRIIARETIPALRKLLGNFGKTGGDRTRKMKLWKKQKRGKERLKERSERSAVRIPASVFKELLKK